MDEFLIVKRGYVYEFSAKTSYPGKYYVLAVSADSRGADRLVSVILLSSAFAPDYVPISKPVPGRRAVLQLREGDVHGTLAADQGGIQGFRQEDGAD